MPDEALDALFANRQPVTRAIYDRLVEVIAGFGPFRIEPKTVSIHIARRSGFAGVHPRKAGLLLNIVLDAPIYSKRVRRYEQVSKNRVHNELLLSSPDDVDRELRAWLAAAYALSA